MLHVLAASKQVVVKALIKRMLSIS